MSALKRRLVSAGAHYFWNPIVRLIAGRPGAPALLETVGCKSGRLRRTPVGNGLKGDTFWIIAEHGRHSDWVRNIMANPPAGEGKRPLAKGSGVPHARRRPHRATTGARPVQRAAGSLLRHGASHRARRSRSREGMIHGRARQFPALWFESSPAELFTRA